MERPGALPVGKVFAQYPQVKASGVDMESTEGGYYMVNSEGSEVEGAGKRHGAAGFAPRPNPPMA